MKALCLNVMHVCYMYYAAIRIRANRWHSSIALLWAWIWVEILGCVDCNKPSFRVFLGVFRNFRGPTVPQGSPKLHVHRPVYCATSRNTPLAQNTAAFGVVRPSSVCVRLTKKKKTKWNEGRKKNRKRTPEGGGINWHMKEHSMRAESPESNPETDKWKVSFCLPRFFPYPDCQSRAIYCRLSELSRVVAPK